ncbi:MAG TPA: DJ-1/PfpI family protein [Alphaproteobacteria bacterium]|nr:DJ-1/PfpI family protein [Alphaproteobacteria bacterium]
MDIAIFVFDDMTALDAIGPMEVVALLPGAALKIVGLQKGPVRAGKGARSVGLVADYALGEVAAADVLIVPGGTGTRALVNDAALTSWIRDIHATTRWTTSVCTGSLLLAAAGLLDGVPATTHWAAMDMLEKLGAVPTDRRVVENGKIITAAGVSSGIDMGLTLAAKIAGDDVAQAIQLMIEYDPEPPFDAGAVSKVSPAIRKLALEFISAG